MGCRGLAVLVWGLLWIAAAAVAEEPEEAEVAQSLQVGNSRLELYGFVRVDAIFDDGRPNSFQSPSFIQPDDPARDDGNFTLHPRLTRLGADVSGPALERLGGAAISGKVEIDFQAGGSESRQLLRLRHGWMQLTWDRSSLLVGQTWDVISPLFPTVNSDTLMWNAGNLGDRRPMIRAQIDRGAFSLAGALGQTGAIDAQDLDGDGASDGGSSGLPHLQARAGWVLPLAGEQELSFGLSGHVAKEETSFPVAGGEDEFDSHSLSLDWKAGLIFLANGIRYSPPNNASQVNGWLRHWNALPDSPLKAVIWERYRAHFEADAERRKKEIRAGLRDKKQDPEALLKAFLEHIAKPGQPATVPPPATSGRQPPSAMPGRSPRRGLQEKPSEARTHGSRAAAGQPSRQRERSDPPAKIAESLEELASRHEESLRTLDWEIPA